MKYCELAQVFFKIEQERSRLTITKLLAELFNQANDEEIYYIAYLTLGTLRAPYKSTTFNFAEKNITKVLARLLDQDYEEYSKRIKERGDIGTSILDTQWPYRDTGFTIEQVYTNLVEIDAVSGVGAQEEKTLILEKLLKQVDKVGAVYIVRVLTGTMRLGFSDMTVIDALSWMLADNKSLKDRLENAYNICADLGLIAQTAKKYGIEGIVKIEPILGIPIRPAAAERLPTVTAVIEKIGPCVAQPKLDGFRVQIHRDTRDQANKTWFFSRNLLDMSAMFPDIQKALSAYPLASVIVEGETIVYNEETDRFMPFQETVRRKRKHAIEEVMQELPLQLYLFDILYYNGEILLDKPHYERRALLEKLFNRYPSSIIHVIEEKYIGTSQELEHYFSSKISEGLEGLVVKRPDAYYQAGKRNFNWIKLKKHQTGQLDDTIDTVILGYYSGRGKRAKFGIGAFLVGVYNSTKDRFETIAKIGTGLTDAEWLELKKLCDSNALSEKPHNVICAIELTPDVWVQPSIAVIVQADEITQSPLHTAGQEDAESGYALRFPRFMGYSIDKSPTQITSVKEIKELYRQQFAL